MPGKVINLNERRPAKAGKAQPDESELCWKCGHCGCKHWFINGDLTMECVGCGRWQPLMAVFDDPPAA